MAPQGRGFGGGIRTRDLPVWDRVGLRPYVPACLPQPRDIAGFRTSSAALPSSEALGFGLAGADAGMIFHQ